MGRSEAAKIGRVERFEAVKIGRVLIASGQESDVSILEREQRLYRKIERIRKRGRF